MKMFSMKSIMAAILCTVMVLSFCACGTNEADTEETDAAAATVSDNEAENNTGNKVYFAGPLFSEGERDFNLQIAKVLEDNGYQVFLPQRDGLKSEDLEGKTEEEQTQMIFEKDVKEVNNADIVFMVLDGRVPDEGACVELGIAYANGKRCYGIKTDSRMAEMGMDLNPMISGCFKKLIIEYDGDKALEDLQKYLSENKL